MTQIPEEIYATDITKLVGSQPNYLYFFLDRMNAMHIFRDDTATTFMCARLNPSMMVDENRDYVTDFLFKLFRGEDFFYIGVAGSNNKLTKLEYLKAVQRLDIDSRYPITPNSHFTEGLKPFQPTVNLVHDYLTM
jgi:hypothetical protein